MVKCLFLHQWDIGVYMLSHPVISNSCNPMGCCLPGSSVHGISLTRILEWAAMPSSRGSRARVSSIGRWILYHGVTEEACSQGDGLTHRGQCFQTTAIVSARAFSEEFIRHKVPNCGWVGQRKLFYRSRSWAWGMKIKSRLSNSIIIRPSAVLCLHSNSCDLNVHSSVTQEPYS